MADYEIRNISDTVYEAGSQPRSHKRTVFGPLRNAEPD